MTSGDELRDQARKAETGGGHYVEQPGAITLNLGAMDDGEWRAYLAAELARLQVQVEQHTALLKTMCGNGAPGLNERLRDTVAKMDAAIAERKSEVALIWQSIRYSNSRFLWAIALSDVLIMALIALHLSGAL